MSEESFKLWYKQQIWHKYSIGVTLQEKKRGPRKISMWPPFSNMAAMGYTEIPFFYLKGQQMVEKDNYDNKFYVLSITNVQTML